MLHIRESHPWCDFGLRIRVPLTSSPNHYTYDRCSETCLSNSESASSIISAPTVTNAREECCVTIDTGTPEEEHDPNTGYIRDDEKITTCAREISPIITLPREIRRVGEAKAVISKEPEDSVSTTQLRLRRQTDKATQPAQMSGGLDGMRTPLAVACSNPRSG